MKLNRPSRLKILGRIADHLIAVRAGHPVRVAFESVGPGCAVFAIHLCSALAARGVTAVYIDAGDFADADELAQEVLAPLGPQGTLHYRERTGGPVQKAEPDTVVVIAGAPGRPEISALWDDVLMLAGPAEERDDTDRASCLVLDDDPDHPLLLRIGGPAGTPMRLFSYGTLQLPAVQQAHFGRLLESARDELVGYDSGITTIGDPDVVAASGSNQHPVVRPSRDPQATVAGTVMLISTEELAAADLYEVDDYRRRLVRLASGVDAWAYVAAG